MLFYLCPRFLQHARLALRGASPRRGVPAGCTFATTWVRVLVMEDADCFLGRWPMVTLDVCIDDWGLDLVGDPAEVANMLPEAALDLADTVTKLGSEFSVDKAAVVASTPRLAATLRARIGRLGGKAFGGVRRLGVDFAPGRPRASWGGPRVLSTRMHKAKRRTSRAAKLFSRDAGPKLKRLFSSGSRAEAAFGVEITGISDAELLALERQEAALLRPTCRGRSLDALLLLRGGSAWQHAAATLVRLSKEIWEAASLGRKGTLSLAELGTLWKTTNTRGDTWRTVKGPLGIARLEAARLGWHFDDEHGRSLRTDLGKNILLTAIPPGRVLAEAVAALRRRK